MLTSLGGDRLGELLEAADVGVDRFVRVGHRQRPLLLAARSHEDPPVHVEQPRELGQLRVLVLLEGLVVDDLLGEKVTHPLPPTPTA